jgi:hypothetical protein
MYKPSGKPVDTGDLVAYFHEYYDGPTPVVAETEHGIFRFEILDIAETEYGTPILILKGITKDEHGKRTTDS